MKKLVLSPLAVILLLILITSVHASVELKATIGEQVDVVLDLKGINSTIYERIIDENLINVTKIPRIITKNLEEEGLENVYYGLPAEPLSFNDEEKAITVRFYLSGSDVLSFTFSRETMRRTCRVKTDWREFELNLTDDFSLNFTEYFDKPLSEWDFSNEMYPTYYCNYTGAIPLDPVCYFVLPREATNIQREGETIVFELPPSLAESLLNSPFLILGAIIVAIIITSLYRTIRKTEEHGLQS